MARTHVQMQWGGGSPTDDVTLLSADKDTCNAWTIPDDVEDLAVHVECTSTSGTDTNPDTRITIFAKYTSPDERIGTTGGATEDTDDGATPLGSVPIKTENVCRKTFAVRNLGSDVAFMAENSGDGSTVEVGLSISYNT